MATYDLKTLTATPCAQFDGTSASLLTVQAICPEARMDMTHDRIVRLPAGGTHGTVRTMYKTDWVFSVATRIFVVMDNASFTALFTATP